MASTCACSTTRVRRGLDSPMLRTRLFQRPLQDGRRHRPRPTGRPGTTTMQRLGWRRGAEALSPLGRRPGARWGPARSLPSSTRRLSGSFGDVPRWPTCMGTEPLDAARDSRRGLEGRGIMPRPRSSAVRARARSASAVRVPPDAARRVPDWAGFEPEPVVRAPNGFDPVASVRKAVSAAGAWSSGAGGWRRTPWLGDSRRAGQRR